MKDLIQTVDGWADLTAEQIREALVSPDPQRRSASEATKHAKTLLAQFEPETIEALVGSLRQAGYQTTADALIATGLDFGHPSMQTRLDQLGQLAPDTFTESIVNDLKSLGVDSRSPWQRAKGDKQEPTVEQVETAKQSLLAEQFGETLAQRVGAAIRLAAVADGSTEQSIRAAAIAEVG